MNSELADVRKRGNWGFEIDEKTEYFDAESLELRRTRRFPVTNMQLLRRSSWGS